MVIAVEDIVDRDSLEAWLNERPEDLRRQCAVWISSRMAARLAPITWDWFHFALKAIARGVNLTPISRSNLLSLVYVFRTTEDFKIAKIVGEAAYSAYAICDVLNYPDHPAVRASYATTRSTDAVCAAADPVDAAGDSVFASSIVYPSSFLEVQIDCQLWLDLEAAGQINIANLQSEPLWSNENPIATSWEELKAKLIADAISDDPRSADWSFWIDWYEGLLEGRVQNIDMLLEIVTTDKIDWGATPREVNEAIAEIVLDFEVKGSDLGIDIDINPETGKFFETLRVSPSQPFHDRVLRRLEYFLRRIATRHNEWGGYFSEVEWIVDDALSHYSDNPVALHDSLGDVEHELARIAQDENLTFLSEEGLFKGLQSEIPSLRLDLEEDEDVREIVEARLKRTLRAYTEDDVAIISAAAKVVAEQFTEGQLKDNLLRISNEATDNTIPQVAKQGVLFKALSLLRKIWWFAKKATDAKEVLIGIGAGAKFFWELLENYKVIQALPYIYGYGYMMVSQLF